MDGGKSDHCDLRKQQRAAKGQHRGKKGQHMGKRREAKCPNNAIAYRYSIHIDVGCRGAFFNLKGAGQLLAKDGGMRSDCHRAERIITLKGQGDYMDADHCAID